MTSRRPRGAGGVYQRKDGRWFARLPIPADGDGPARDWNRYCPKTNNTEAYAWSLLAQMTADQAARRAPPDARITVAQWLEEWHREVVTPGGVYGTIRIRRQAITRLTPLVGNLRLAALTPGHIQRALNRLAATLAPQTVVTVYQGLHAALGVAVRWGRIPTNPASQARPPRVPRADVRVLTEAEAQRFVAAAREDRLGALFLTALAVGVRRGEATGLRLVDLDLARGTLTVTQQIQFVPKVGAVVTETKGHDRRVLRLPALLRAALAEHVATLARHRSSARRWEEHGLIFPSTVGTPMRAAPMEAGLARILAAAAIPHLTIHGLRHSCATLLLAQGVPEAVIVELLGHSSPALLHRTYGHVLETMRDQGAAAMDRVLTAPETPSGGQVGGQYRTGHTKIARPSGQKRR